MNIFVLNKTASVMTVFVLDMITFDSSTNDAFLNMTVFALSMTLLVLKMTVYVPIQLYI